MLRPLLLRTCMVLLLYMFCLPGLSAQAWAAPVSAAVYVDTDFPGSSFVTQGLNELVKLKLNLLFMDSLVQTGSEVVKGLTDCGITASGASVDSLAAYCQKSGSEYVFLLFLRPSEASLELKLYSAVSHSFALNQTIAYEAPDSNTSLWDKGKLTYERVQQALDKVWPILEETIKKQRPA